MVVEITPIGIQNLQWKFYIIWTLFNAAFIPVVYFLYVSQTIEYSPPESLLI